MAFRRPMMKPALVPVTLACAALGQAQSGFRPPAVPLVTHDPYFSVWSMTDTLNGGATRHWTGSEQPLTSLIRVDGKTFTLMGKPRADAPAMRQTGLQVLPTRTIYTFEGGDVAVKMTFTSPLLTDDLDVFSRPASYIAWDVTPKGLGARDVAVYFDASGMLAVDKPDQMVTSQSQTTTGGITSKIGSQDQPVLGKTGDDLRIDWGYLYLFNAAKASEGNVNSGERNVASFVKDGTLALGDDRMLVHRPTDRVAASVLRFGKIGKPTSRYTVLAYDDEYSIQFFGKNLRPYWRRNGMDAARMLSVANRDYLRLKSRCEKFDAELMADMEKAGGKDYATLGALAYRQSFAAQKLVADKNGQPLMFSKENFSNGCIATVDVLYPAAPQLLLFSPALTKASLVPIMEYAASPRWKWPFAPHDLGTYPLANGQVYGGGERTEENQMPVEETGNMLILLAALAKKEGNADFSATYWPQLSKWAAYLADKGFDPESQLSTDDFAGHLAHNVNLSAKAIEALGAYAYLCDLRGMKAEGERYRAMAKGFADRWQKEAMDGDHYRLAFDKPGTWSQKYNLVWDRLLDFRLFPDAVSQREIAYYKTRFNRYGLPLDNRRDYTKLDWTVWTATLTPNRADFETLVRPIVKFLNETPDRAPMPDWYRTEEARKEGFQARSVVGGVFIKLLEDRSVWNKYADRDRTKVGGWAPIPKPPVITEIVPTSENAPIEWFYTTEKPDANWSETGFTPRTGWRRGPAGFGTEGTPGTTVRTLWNTNDIWIRRDFEIAGPIPDDLQLYIHHDENAEVYLNGILVARLGGYTAQYQPKPMLDAWKTALKPGKNTLAIHCHQTGGGQYIDAGFARVKYVD